MHLDQEQKKHFRRIGHHLKPVLTITDKGFGETHALELDRALEDHELIKVKINVLEREDRQLVVEALCESGRAQVVLMIGKMALLYRPAKKPNPKLSNLLRFAG